MNSRERVFAAIKGKEFDVFPAITPTSIATIEGMQSSNAFFPTAHTNAIQMADLAATGYELFGFDTIAPYFSVHLEAAALGATVDFSDVNNTPFVIKRSMAKIDDFSLPCNFLAKKEFQVLLQTISILKSRYKQSVPIIGKVIGPWTLAYNLYGVENLILDTILEPEKTQALIEELSVIPMAFALAQFEAGADIITWAEHATSDLVSPQIYERYLFPIHRKAASTIQMHGPIILHICGNVMDRLPLIARTGIKMLHIDSRNNLKEAVALAGDSLLLTGAINNPVSLVQGTVYSITQEVIRNLREGIRLISPECAIPTNVPTQNLRAITETAHRLNPQTLWNSV